MYCAELFCKDGHQSRFCINSPDSRNLLPTLTNQLLPHSLCLAPTQVLTGLQECWGSIRHRTPLIHEDEGILQPTLLIPLEPISPSVFRVPQPTVSQRTLLISSSYILLLLTGSASRAKPKECALMASTDQQGQDDRNKVDYP